jgi:hypothetical protein
LSVILKIPFQSENIGLVIVHVLWMWYYCVSFEVLTAVKMLIVVCLQHVWHEDRIRSSKTLVTTCKTAWHHNPEDHSQQLNIALDLIYDVWIWMTQFKCKVEKTYTRLQYVETWYSIQHFWARKTHPVKKTEWEFYAFKSLKEKGSFFTSDIKGWCLMWIKGK